MPTQFSQTTRSLANDRSLAPIFAWLSGIVLLGAWSLWFAFGDVTVYETSRKARLEVMQLPHHVAAPLSGRIASASVAIGQEVFANQALIALDASAETLRLAEEEARLTSLPPQIASMRAELVSLEQAKDEDLRATQAALEAAGARVKEAEAMVQFARNNESRLRKQSAVGGVAEIDALRARSEADKLSASKDAMAADLRRLEQDRQVRAHEAEARIETLKRSIVSLKGEMATTRVAVARIQQTIGRHVIRAPVTGRIGDVAALSVGAYVAEGQRLVSVVPPGELMIVGDFAPRSAMGRVRPGQRATMRLDGFPWAQYGSINATVSRVATEIRDGAVRVEFTPAPAGNPTRIMQHGLPGVIEVAVERATPASLVLRAAGLMLSGAMRQTSAELGEPAE
ncbi:MAG TPA: HlyD family efflux transporter periplasmic adaptor subunit [Acetobacteraceae bacterium]|nr:HlyD family efflux transporter periplasmic adaptor subunit [Acetobacteraceae bacterium]